MFDELTRMPNWETLQKEAWPWTSLLDSYSFGIKAVYATPLEKELVSQGKGPRRK
jgi:hypothetical protein